MNTPKTRAQMSRVTYRQHHAYQKTRQQKTRPTYLQNKIVEQINNRNSGYLQKLQKQLHTYHPLYNPQAQFIDYQQIKQQNTISQSSNTISVNKDRGLLSEEQREYNHLKQKQDQNRYQLQFLHKNQQKNAHSKVERQKINIQYDNYKTIMNECLKDIEETVDQFIESVEELQNKFKQGHQVFMEISHEIQLKRSNEKSRIKPELKLQNLKKRSIRLKEQQNNLQNKIQKISIKLRTLLRNRNNFIKYLLNQGYYQQNGLIWIILQLIHIEQFDKQITPTYTQKCEKLGLKSYSNMFLIENQCINIQQLTNYMPKILDHKSKQYIIKTYNRIKDKKIQEQKQQNHIRQRIKTNMQKSQKKQYIIDPNSQIFGNSLTNRQQQPTTSNLNTNTNSNAQLIKNKYEYLNLSPKQSQKNTNLLSLKSNPSFLVSKNHDNILQRSNIIGMYKDVQAHTRNQKYNYDIKNIYANTRQSLLKWIKGKCKDIVLNKQSSSQTKQNTTNIQYSNQHITQTPTQTPERVETQNSGHFLEYSRARSKKSSSFLDEYIKKPGSSFNSPIYFNPRSKSPIQKYKGDQNQQQMKAGFSLPLIVEKNSKNQKRKLSQKERIPKQISSVTKSGIKKLKKNISLGVSQINNTNTTQAIIKFKNKINKREQKIIDEGLSQKAQQIRILRIYKKQDQQMALKYLFGIKIKKQTLMRMLFYQ